MPRNNEPMEETKGRRTILMSDVVGSSSVSQFQGDQAYYELVMKHHDLVRGEALPRGGIEFSEGGDSLFLWFPTPVDAVRCARSIQALVGAMPTMGAELRVKIGIAGGDPFFAQGRPYGSVVNRAARLADVAVADQIVVDEFTMSSLEASERRCLSPSTVDLRGLGPHQIGILADRADEDLWRKTTTSELLV